MLNLKSYRKGRSLKSPCSVAELHKRAMQTSSYRADAFQKCPVKDINGVLFAFFPEVTRVSIEVLA